MEWQRNPRNRSPPNTPAPAGAMDDWLVSVAPAGAIGIFQSTPGITLSLHPRLISAVPLAQKPGGRCGRTAWMMVWPFAYGRFKRWRIVGLTQVIQVNQQLFVWLTVPQVLPIPDDPAVIIREDRASCDGRRRKLLAPQIRRNHRQLNARGSRVNAGVSRTAEITRRSLFDQQVKPAHPKRTRLPTGEQVVIGCFPVTINKDFPSEHNQFSKT